MGPGGDPQKNEVSPGVFGGWYGPQLELGYVWTVWALGRVARRNAQSGTSDLFWQTEGDRGRAEPGEQRAALIPWREEKGEPRAAGRSSPTDGPARRKGAADAPKGWGGGMDFAPVGVASPGEQRPGPLEGGLPNGPFQASGELEERGTTSMKLPERSEARTPAEVPSEVTNQEVTRRGGMDRYCLRPRISAPEKLKDYVRL
ncbi:hypothetical protein NDU88_006099 [Pleurodeles waltl]|uniref:Uncharacterized protein n=1 Tax=Pleurodeles waltl TaxID=8319 RepID=A0AAV7RN01_PLEWA|nr:hypothetical protein NDU88_006099 [Pleurodeles waltl]